jgi:hypothetical protein
MLQNFNTTEEVLKVKSDYLGLSMANYVSYSTFYSFLLLSLVLNVSSPEVKQAYIFSGVMFVIILVTHVTVDLCFNYQ